MTDEEYRRADWWLSKAQAAPYALTPWEIDFVDTLTEQLARWGRETRISPAQWQTLEQIASKAS